MSNPRKKCTMINWVGMILYMILQKGTNAYVHLHQPKKWLQEAKAQGWDWTFFDWILADDLQRLAHRKKVASPGQSSTDRTWWDEFKNFVSTRPNCKTCFFFFWKYICPCKRGQPHMFSFTNQKKVTWRGRGAGVKNKIQGTGPFLTEYLRMIFKGWPTGKKSHHQANHPQIGHDGTNSRILCQRAQIAKHVFFFLKIHLSLQKGYNHICSASPTKKRWLEEAEAQVSKIKSKGLDLFLAEFLWMVFKGWPHRKNVASPGQPSIDRKWWDKLKNFVPTCGQIAKQAFFSWRYICPCKRVAALPWASAGPHSWSRGLWKTASCQPGSQVPGIHFFSVSDWGGKMWHVTNASIQEIIFLLGYQRGKFIGCWTLGTRKLAKKIQKGGWKWDFGFRG